MGQLAAMKDKIRRLERILVDIGNIAREGTDPTLAVRPAVDMRLLELTTRAMDIIDEA